MSIAVCALTYKRPNGLRRLIAGLQAQQFGGPSPDVRVVVVDNDPDASAREICARLADGARWPIQYVVEQRAGIACARNAALDNVGDAELVCFIDDDEVPDERWLDELLSVRCAYGADVVGGPVIPHFPEAVPEWVLKGGFFHRQRYRTGQRRPYAFTNNVLFRRQIVDELSLRFNERWALMGCEDQAFFSAIGQAGYKIVWANDAIVTEWVPLTRANAEWLIRRLYRVGNSTSFIERDLRSRWWLYPALLSRSAAWLVIGAGRLVTSPVCGRVAYVRAIQAFAYAAGLFTGVLGRPYEEYRRTSDKQIPA